MNISYIIATYAGKDHTSNKDVADIVLQEQFNQLFALLKNKQKYSCHCAIVEVIVVCPPVDSENLRTNYYLKDSWKESLDKFGISLRCVDYVGENIHHSYDQWIQGCMNASPDSDYYILIEDDYCLDQRNVNLELDMINLYLKKFPNNIGYLASWAPKKDPNHGYHAAISNGLISKDTFEKFENPLEDFYGITKSIYPQVNFSLLFLYNRSPSFR